MIIETLTAKERETKLGQWHPHFAWLPVRWDGGWAWLSWVERRLKYTDFEGDLWEYRAPRPARLADLADIEARVAREEAEEDDAVLDWLEAEHQVFRDGYPAGMTKISPEAADAVCRYGIDACINATASEPRWEAVCGQHLALADDPNEAILACARKVRGELPPYPLRAPAD